MNGERHQVAGLGNIREQYTFEFGFITLEHEPKPRAAAGWAVFACGADHQRVQLLNWTSRADALRFYTMLTLTMDAHA